MNTIQLAFDRAMQVGKCPLWHPEEAVLYWVDVAGLAVHQLNPANGMHRSWPMPAEPSGIARNATGGLIVALRNGFFHLDTSDGALREIALAPYDCVTTRFNDGRCDAAGRFWIGSMYEPRDRQTGTIYCLDRGEVQQRCGGVPVSNGFAFSPDHRILYHADAAAHLIRRYPFDLKSGAIGTPQIVRRFSTDRSYNYGGCPEGAAVDSEGAYWCAMFEGGRLLRLSPEGKILRSIPLPVHCPTTIAFGGKDLRTLYITSARYKRSALELEEFPWSGSLLSMQVEVPGLAEHAYIGQAE